MPLSQASVFFLLFASLCIIALPTPRTASSQSPRVLILGGGVAGIIAARTLREHGVDNFVIIEAREELGGRMRSHLFAGHTVELGANWVQGIRIDASGSLNPILELVKKHELEFQESKFESITTYDHVGAVDFLGAVNRAFEAYYDLTIKAGHRVARNLVDMSSRAGFSIIGAKPRTAHERAAEYLAFDWEFAQKPDQTSWTASSWASQANNYTFGIVSNDFKRNNLLVKDQRGFKHIIQEEAMQFLQHDQLLLNSTVTRIQHGTQGVAVTLSDGRQVKGDFALCTFSLGVLQNDDVVFQPTLPHWKVEGIHSMTMGTYTKIFLKFPYRFWFDTEFGLYADPERGAYPVWQSLDLDGFYPGSGLLVATVTGDFSQRIESLPTSAVQQEVMDVLRAMYPNVDIPSPTDFYFHRWHADPLYRGSYSNWPPSFLIGHHDNVRSNVGRLYFAGEATSRKYFGYLHGAYFEGRDAASTIAECIKTAHCPEMRHHAEVINDQANDVSFLADY